MIPQIMYLVEERCALCHLLDYKTSDKIPQMHTEEVKRLEDHRDSRFFLLATTKNNVKMYFISMFYSPKKREKS